VISSLKTSRDATTVPNRSRPERTSGFAHVSFQILNKSLLHHTDRISRKTCRKHETMSKESRGEVVFDIKKSLLGKLRRATLAGHLLLSVTYRRQCRRYLAPAKCTCRTVSACRQGVSKSNSYHSGCPRVDSRFWVLVSQSYYRSPRGRFTLRFLQRLVRLRGTGWSWRSAVTNLSDSLSRSQCQTSPYLYLEYPFVAPAARMLGHWSNLLPESQDFRRPELLGAIIRGSTLFYFVPHPSLVSV